MVSNKLRRRIIKQIMISVMVEQTCACSSKLSGPFFGIVSNFVHLETLVFLETNYFSSLCLLLYLKFLTLHGLCGELGFLIVFVYNFSEVLKVFLSY